MAFPWCLKPFFGSPLILAGVGGMERMGKRSLTSGSLIPAQPLALARNTLFPLIRETLESRRRSNPDPDALRRSLPLPGRR